MWLGISLFHIPSSSQSRPFDPQYYEDEEEEDDNILDEEGRARLRLRMENTMRWRFATDPETGEEIKESNSRIIKYNDGSMVMQVGSELFDITSMPLTDHNHLFIRQGTGLQGQAVFQQKLSFRPISTNSLTHKKVMTKLQQRAQLTTSQVKIMHNVGDNPELAGYKNYKAQEQKLKQHLKNQANKKRSQARKGRPSESSTKMTADYMKSNSRRRNVSDIYSDDETSSSEEEAAAKSKSKSKKGNLSSSEEEEEEAMSIDDSEDSVPKSKSKRVLDSDSDD